MVMNLSANSIGKVYSAIDSAPSKGYSAKQITNLVKDGADELLLNASNKLLKKGKDKNKILAGILNKKQALENSEAASNEYSKMVTKNETKFTVKKAYRATKKAIVNTFNKIKEATINAFNTTKEALTKAGKNTWQFIKNHKVAAAVVGTIVAATVATIAILKAVSAKKETEE